MVSFKFQTLQMQFLAPLPQLISKCHLGPQTYRSVPTFDLEGPRKETRGVNGSQFKISFKMVDVPKSPSEITEHCKRNDLEMISGEISGWGSCNILIFSLFQNS
jgi:hypothetical protein